MSVKQFPVEFEVSGFPQEVEVEQEVYQLDRINRLRDNGSSALLIVYREKR